MYGMFQGIKWNTWVSRQLRNFLNRECLQIDVNEKA